MFLVAILCILVVPTYAVTETLKYAPAENKSVISGINDEVLASEATEQFPNNKQNHLDAIYSWNDREIDTKLGGSSARKKKKRMVALTVIGRYLDKSVRGQQAVSLLLRGALPTRINRADLKVFVKPGDYKVAAKDFKSVFPTRVKDLKPGIEGDVSVSGVVGDRKLIIDYNSYSGILSLRVIKGQGSGILRGIMAKRALLKGAQPILSVMPDVKVFVKQGDYKKALKDFYSVGPIHVRDRKLKAGNEGKFGRVGDRILETEHSASTGMSKLIIIERSGMSRKTTTEIRYLNPE